MKSRGFKNNNPLNIRRGLSHWVGQCEQQTDKQFVQFESMAQGFRAAWKILSSYCRRFKTTDPQPFNVRNIIYRWAPPSDGNDTEAYIRRVLMLIARMPVEEYRINIDGEEQVMAIGSLGGEENLMPPESRGGKRQLAKLLRAMTCVENGCQLEEVSLRDINAGHRLAFSRKQS